MIVRPPTPIWSDELNAWVLSHSFLPIFIIAYGILTCECVSRWQLSKGLGVGLLFGSEFVEVAAACTSEPGIFPIKSFSDFSLIWSMTKYTKRIAQQVIFFNKYNEIINNEDFFQLIES